LTYNVDFLDGLATLIQSAGIGTYRPTGVYLPGETAITIGVTPSEPDRNITITTYPIADSDLTTVTTGLQVRIRGGRDPREAEGIADQMYDLLHNKSHYKLGQDTDQRMERAENFYFHAERAAPNQIA
jgi:hypothetical protein